MGISNPLHIAFLLMIALLVFGAKRLPEMGKSLGEGLRGFKSAIDGESTPTELVAPTAAPAIAAVAPVTAPAIAAPALTAEGASPAQDAQVIHSGAETPATLVGS
jgi:sec-independent protein translocase protein TatA